jgi:hypothetical protein
LAGVAIRVTTVPFLDRVLSAPVPPCQRRASATAATHR